MDYAFEHQGKAYTPNETQGITNVEEHNKQLEKQEIEWLKTAPDKLFLYCQYQPDLDWQVTTWLGTVVSSYCHTASRVYVGFNGAYRRALKCTIFGVRYVGWYMESSGNYCRLRKAKR